MIKGSIQQEDVTILDVYAPSIEASKYIQQILTDIKGDIDSNTIKVGNFNTPLVVASGGYSGCLAQAPHCGALSRYTAQLQGAWAQ